MAKSKQKPAAAVKRPQVPLQVPVPSHTNQGGSLVLDLKSALGTLDGAISHIPRADLPPPLLSSHPTVQVQALPERQMGLRWTTQKHLLMGSLRWTVLKTKNLEKNNLISLVLKKTMKLLPHHLLPLRWLLTCLLLCPRWFQYHQLVPKVPPLPRPALFKQVTLLFPRLLMENREIYSLPTETSHLVQSLYTFQPYMIFNPVLF
jgi:hypothetical protein